MNIDDALDNLLKTSEMNSVQKTEPRQRQEWLPGVTWQGEEGTVTTQPMEGDNAPDWSRVLRMWGLDPEHFQVVEPVLFNVWGDTLGILNRQWKGLLNGLLLTVILGIIFTSFQAYEYIHADFKLSSGIYGATFYMHAKSFWLLLIGLVLTLYSMFM